MISSVATGPTSPLSARCAGWPKRRTKHAHLDALVNNAGVFARERAVFRDGHELAFAVNFLAPFLLTYLLVPLLRGSTPARVVNVASADQNPVNFDDPMLERG